MDQVFMDNPGNAVVEWFVNRRMAGCTRIVLDDGSEYLLNIRGTADPCSGYEVVKTISGTERPYFSFGGKDVGYGCISGGDRIRITEIYFGTDVTSIAAQLFMDHDEDGNDIDNGVLRKVSIPDTVVSIGYQAFNQCTSLEELVIPDSVTGELNYTCAGSGVSRVVIGSGVQSLNYAPFAFDMSLTTVEMRGKPTGSHGFSSSTGISRVIFGCSFQEARSYIESSYMFAICVNEGQQITFTVECTDETHTCTQRYSRGTYTYSWDI